MNKSKVFTTQRITRDAMLAAACAVLGYISLSFGNLKITFESLPVLLAAFMFGPVDGMLVGGIGTFIYQVLRYGMTATTLLWILPYVLCGLFTGLAAKGSKNRLDQKRIMLIVVLMGIMIFVVNTFGIYVDSKIYGYYSAAYVFGTVGIRFVLCIVKYVVFGFVMPVLLKGLRMITPARG